MQLRLKLDRSLLTAVIAFAAASLFAQQRTVVTPADTGAALVNPGMGWVFHHYDNSIEKYGLHLEPSDTVDEFPGASVIYLRLAWSYVEPEEGKFNWSIVDTPAQRWIDKGFQVAFRFSCAESNPKQPYATPKWVRDAGAKGYNFTPRKGIDPTGEMWEPDYDDPVFLAKLSNFLAAAAARYDGNKEVAFLDVGSFGVWGEGHTSATTRLEYSARTVKTHMDLWRKHFKKSLLVVSDGMANNDRGIEVIHYADRLGMTLRDDSILVWDKNTWPSRNRDYLARLFWADRPVVLESQHYGPSKTAGYWEDGELYMTSIEAYHASYASVHWYPREFLSENRSLIDRINQRLGYRLQLLEASWPPEVSREEPLLVGYRWRNAGVARCYRGGYPAITLKDAKGGLAGVFVDEGFDVAALPVGLPGEALALDRTAPNEGTSQASKPLIAFQLPPAGILKAGVYDIFVSVGTRTGTPEIALPLGDDDGRRRYLLGKVTIK